jgi:transcriptional regulator with XRE-family HTH domain
VLPFGQTVLAWRLERGLTQAALAERARLARPNLSAIERGSREVSLKTVRALALALGVRPGVLADGTAPGEDPPRNSLGRPALERIAEAVVKGRTLLNPHEAALVHHLKNLVRARLSTRGAPLRGSRRSVRRTRKAWLAASRYPSGLLGSLVQRVMERSGL